MNALSYRYLDDGTKLSCESVGYDGTPVTGKYYKGSFVYAASDGDSGELETSLEYITTPFGMLRITPDDDEIPIHDIYFVKDHLGSVRQVLDLSLQIDVDPVLEQNDYLPYGTRIDYGSSSLTDTANPYRFAGKEEQKSSTLDSGLLDFGARYYSPYTCRWTTPDPMAQKYTKDSPYNYCTGNPAYFVDQQGAWVTASTEAQRNILYTLSTEESLFVRFNDDGVLDNELLSMCTSDSECIRALKSLSNSSLEYIVLVSDNAFGDSFFKRGDDSHNPDNYYYGVTCMPDAKENPSPNNSVYIFTASFLSEKEKVSNTAHELYGHAYFYEMSRTNPAINPNHTRGVVGTISEYYEGIGYIEGNIYGPTNTALENQINKVVTTALKNYEKYWK